LVAVFLLSVGGKPQIRQELSPRNEERNARDPKGSRHLRQRSC